MRIFKIISLIGLIALSFYGIIAARKPMNTPIRQNFVIAVTIKPIHGLVAAISDGVFDPILLVQGNTSPHTYALTPKESQILSKADLVIWIGDIYESHMAQSIKNLVPSNKLLTLSETKDLTLYSYRSGDLWGEGHSHSHDHHDHDEDHVHDHSHCCAHGNKDGHIWLDPKNAAILAEKIADTLTTMDPSHADIYKANTKKLLADLQELDQDLKKIIQPIQNKPYLLYHDGTQYFDHYFGTHAIAAITTEVGLPPKTKHLMNLRAHLADQSSAHHPICIFEEPQFPSEISKNLATEFSVKIQTLDYLGQHIQAGPKAYFEIMRQLANDFVKGLSE